MSRHNPEKRAWRGRSYKKGGKLVRSLKESDMQSSDEAHKPQRMMEAEFEAWAVEHEDDSEQAREFIREARRARDTGEEE